MKTVKKYNNFTKLVALVEIDSLPLAVGQHHSIAAIAQDLNCLGKIREPVLYYLSAKQSIKVGPQLGVSLEKEVTYSIEISGSLCSGM